MLRAMLLGMLVISGCGQVGATRPDSLPPLRSDQAAATVTTEIARPLEEVFDYVVREDTPARDLAPRGPIAQVRGAVRLTAGGWDHAGARRVVVFADASTLLEQIERFERPQHFAYQVKDFTAAVRTLAVGGHGVWEFTPSASGTRISWTYTFTARSRATRSLLRTMVRLYFHPYMVSGMASIQKHLLEGSSS